MASLLAMLNQLEGLLGTEALSGWEADFVENTLERIESDETFAMTTKQYATIRDLWEKHFA